MRLRQLEKVILYDENVAGMVNLEEIADYLREKLGAVPSVEIRGNPFNPYLARSADFARKLAAAKIHDVTRRMISETVPLYGEIQYEERKILGKTRAFGVLYDGFRLLRVFAELIPPDERGLGLVHIFLTNRLFVTWAEDQRYHARTSVYGLPSIISTTGLVEAPAKPREYYLLKQQYEMLGKDILELNERFKGRCLGCEDSRLTPVMKGYVMQAVFYALSGDPFCQDKGCKLYNAHWQEELIFAQLESHSEFCQRHAELLAGWRQN
tara:strand:- start:95 stop:895 length:801 start_codon:yes stop_codon:yes gene_type:complete